MVESDFKLPIPNSSTQYVSKNSIPECFRMRMSELRLKPIEGFIVIIIQGQTLRKSTTQPIYELQETVLKEPLVCGKCAAWGGM